MPSAAPPSAPLVLAAGDLLSDLSLSASELRALLDLAHSIKRNPTRYASSLRHRYLSQLFEKPSLRTRLTFELAIMQLGGDAVSSVGPIGDREPTKDIARNLDRWTNAIVARTFRQDTIDELAKWSSVPVINALSDLYHPCQVFADMQTIEERFGSAKGLKLTFVGDGNNVAVSLMQAAALAGTDFAIAAPIGFQIDPGLVEEARAVAKKSGSEVVVTTDPEEAASEADALYADVWLSMGDSDSTRAARHEALAPYQITAQLLDQAKPDALFMHCLPAHRGEEVTAEVADGPRSVIFDQAENRLHTAAAILYSLIEGKLEGARRG